MSNKTFEKYIEEFKVKDYINVYTSQSKSNDLYRAYQVIKAERYKKEIESIKYDTNACINLMTSNYISTPFICKETKEKLTVSEVKDKCLNCAKCPGYKMTLKLPIDCDNELYKLVDKKEQLSFEEQEEQEELFDNDDIKSTLKYYEQEDYNNLYYTKIFNEYEATSIQESIWHFLKENHPIQHKTNKMIAVLKHTLNDRDTFELEYITYNDIY